MLFARMVEAKKDMKALGLVVTLVEQFFQNLQEYINNENQTPKGSTILLPFPIHYKL
jgi:K+-sensing histidine kinase KdpD